MGKGWGYGKTSMSISDKIKTGKQLVFESNDMKVYEYVLKSSVYTYFKDIKIRYINRLNNNKKIIVMSGLYKAINYDCTNFKNQEELFEHVADKLIELYIDENKKIEDNYFNSKENYMFCINNMNNIEKLEQNQFNKFIDSFIDSINEFENDTRKNIWSRLYNDMFERTNMYDDFEITLTHDRYLKAISQISE